MSVRVPARQGTDRVRVLPCSCIYLMHIAPEITFEMSFAFDELAEKN